MHVHKLYIRIPQIVFGTAVLCMMMFPYVAHGACSAGYVSCGKDGGCIPENCVCLLEPLPSGAQYVCEGGFFEYLNIGGGSSLWMWALGIGAGLCVLNVVIGGFQIMTATMDPGAITAGKTRIIGSIIGLIFLLFAGVFLNFINPLAFTT